MTKADYDLCIIGGGINGAGIARDAAGRGLSVLLVEAQDLAGATSSASSKMIHGGLRYLEHYEFRLVREALAERETLMRLAPHIVRPMEFILPHEPHLRPAWMIRAGLFLYDHLARHDTLPNSHGLNFLFDPAGAALQPQYRKGFSYADCVVDDARLVVLNAVDAAERGATLLTRTACLNMRQGGGLWQITLKNLLTGQETRVAASMAVNAAGPWVRSFLDGSGLTGPDTPRIRMVKGSHIVVPRLHDLDRSFILQQPDGRVVFVIPYEGSSTLVGTTDIPFDGDPSAVAIDDNEIQYLCAAVNRSFRRQITEKDIIWHYSGVRPLLDDGHAEAAAVTRDYKLVLDRRHGPPLLSVFGGKITTYRKLAEHALDELCGGQRWTETAHLPGGDIAGGDFEKFVQEQEVQYHWLPAPLVRRYARTYGTRMEVLLGDAGSIEDLGHHMGDGIFEAELYYLANMEWAVTVEDILWRRSKLGLHVAPETVETLERYLPRIVREAAGT